MDVPVIDIDFNVAKREGDIMKVLEVRRLKREIRPMIMIVQQGPLSDWEKKVFQNDPIKEDQEVDDVLIDKLQETFEELRIKVECQKAIENELFEKVIMNRNLLKRTDNPSFEFTNARVGIIESLKILLREQSVAIESRYKWISAAVAEIREELVAVWRQCMVLDAASANFPDFYSNDFSEDLLESHKVELDLWKDHHGKFQVLFNQIRKRTKLWTKVIELQAKSEDPKRFENRGGSLLKNEKEMNVTISSLLRTEDKLVSLANSFERDNGKRILVEGEDMGAMIKGDWKRFENEILSRGLRPPLIKTQAKHTGWTLLQAPHRLSGLAKSLPDISSGMKTGSGSRSGCSSSRCHTHAPPKPTKNLATFCKENEQFKSLLYRRVN